MTTGHTEQGCIRGCFQEGVHFASCKHVGSDYVGPFPCKGCAPEPTRKGVLICDGCYRRIRGLLLNAHDLLRRMRSLAAQGKAVAYTPAKVFAVRATSPEPVDADLADALIELPARFAHWGPPNAMVRNLDAWAADEETIIALSAWVVDAHTEDGDGARVWSLADAMGKWGAERRDRHVYPSSPALEDGELVRLPVTEWYDGLLVSKDAAERAGVTESQLRRWVQAEVLTPRARLRDASGVVTRWFRASDVDAAAAKMRARRHAGIKLPSG